MNKVVLIITATLISFSAAAQMPAPETDTAKIPIKQTDPVPDQMPEDLHYVDERNRISTEELPAPVLENLKKAEPADWQQSVTYYDKEKKRYMVEVRKGGQQHVYYFARNGKQLKVVSEDTTQEDKKENNHHN